MVIVWMDTKKEQMRKKEICSIASLIFHHIKCEGFVFCVTSGDVAVLRLYKQSNLIKCANSSSCTLIPNGKILVLFISPNSIILSSPRQSPRNPSSQVQPGNPRQESLALVANGAVR